RGGRQAWHRGAAPPTCPGPTAASTSQPEATTGSGPAASPGPARPANASPTTTSSRRTGRSPAVWAAIGGIPAPTARPRTCSCRPDATPQATTSGPVTPTSQNATSQTSSWTSPVTEPRSVAVRGHRDASTDIAASTVAVNVASTTSPAPASSGQVPVRVASTGTATAHPNPSTATAVGGTRSTDRTRAVRYAARCQ